MPRAHRGARLQRVEHSLPLPVRTLRDPQGLLDHHSGLSIDNRPGQQLSQAGWRRVALLPNAVGADQRHLDRPIQRADIKPLNRGWEARLALLAPLLEISSDLARESPS